MKNNKYTELKERQQAETNALPIHFAFGDRQLKEKAEELGFETVDEMIENVTGIGAGGFVLKNDLDLILNTFKRHSEEMGEALKDDDFLKEAFEYELGNHEYIITYDVSDALRPLGITYEEYQTSERYQNIMKKAVKNYMDYMEKCGW